MPLCPFDGQCKRKSGTAATGEQNYSLVARDVRHVTVRAFDASPESPPRLFASSFEQILCETFAG